jgi:hypothetical protein
MPEFWRDLSNKPNQFIPKEIFFADSVPDIEYNVESNKFNDPSKYYIHLTKKQGELFPELSNPDFEINIYCMGSLYHDLLIGIRLNLSNEIIKRIK